MTDSVPDNLPDGVPSGVPGGDDMLEMQAKLRADGDGAERGRLLGVLDTLRTDLKRRIDRGVAPAEFRALQALTEAADTAGEVIEAASRRYHPSAKA